MVTLFQFRILGISLMPNKWTKPKTTSDWLWVSP